MIKCGYCNAFFDSNISRAKHEKCEHTQTQRMFLTDSDVTRLINLLQSQASRFESKRNWNGEKHITAMERRYKIILKKLKNYQRKGINDVTTILAIPAGD